MEFEPNTYLIYEPENLPKAEKNEDGRGMEAEMEAEK
jgi:hypothetical protein